MRLISTSDLKLHTFLDNAIPPYSILSHTWGSEEVSYQEMLQPSYEVRERTGYSKISKCAEISRRMGYSYTWVDTCCIDKTSSAELSESINSMYAWYRKAEVCIVYLEDFGGHSMQGLSKSNRWFTRGWTIQELIAPSEVIFFSRRWEKIGEKAGNTDILARITLIHSEALDSRPLQEFSVAEKMKWASDRETTRTEDMAYCMLGIFDVNMPLIYGEGEKSFQRLQEEIMRNSDDVSILFWTSPAVKGTIPTDPFVYRGALARSPGEFSQSMAPITPMYSLEEPFDSTNKGLRLTVDLIRVEDVYDNLDFSGREEFRDIWEDIHSQGLCFLAVQNTTPEDKERIREQKRSREIWLDEQIQGGHNIDTPDTPYEWMYLILLRRLGPKTTNRQFIRAYPSWHGLVECTRDCISQETIFITEKLQLWDFDVVLPCRDYDVIGLDPQRQQYFDFFQVVPTAFTQDIATGNTLLKASYASDDICVGCTTSRCSCRLDLTFDAHSSMLDLGLTNNEGSYSTTSLDLLTSHDGFLGEPLVSKWWEKEFRCLISRKNSSKGVLLEVKVYKQRET